MISNCTMTISFVEHLIAYMIRLLSVCNRHANLGAGREDDTSFTRVPFLIFSYRLLSSLRDLLPSRFCAPSNASLRPCPLFPSAVAPGQACLGA